ncbi:MAG: NAD(P)-dependent oxidoreductase [Actinomycetota bacterium]|nr:NAD(P)-dependent oxidoreductase [Actinomycetota bacterium]
MTAVILGANGQLGRALCREFPDAVALGRAELDVADPAAVRDFDWSAVDVVLNAAAYTNVDSAEDPANHAVVRATNTDAVGYLAEQAERWRCTLVHVSTEYVFDGRHPGPMPEDLTPSPLSIYGQSKADGDVHLAGLERHYLIRTTWVVGEGRNFVATMAGLADRGVQPAVVADQVGRPTFTRDLAGGIAHLLATGAPFGTYNLTNDGDPVSWADLAAAIYVARGRPAGDVRRVSTAEYFADKPEAAPRPLNGVLDLRKITATGFRPRNWRSALREYLSGGS